MAHIAAREKIIHYMETNDLDVLLLSETHVNTNSTEKHDKYIFVFSTKITDAQRKAAEETKAKKLDCCKRVLCGNFYVVRRPKPRLIRARYRQTVIHHPCWEIKN